MFKKSTTDSILSSFNTIVNKLVAHAETQRVLAADDADVAYEYTQRHEEKIRDAEAAEAAAKKLKALLS